MNELPEGFEPLEDHTTIPEGFEPLNVNVKQDLTDTVSNVYPDIEEDRETVERLKTVQFLSKKGYNVDVDNVDDYKRNLFKDSGSYESVNKELAQQLSVEPKGEVVKTAKMKPSYGFKAAIGKLSEWPHHVKRGVSAYGLWSDTMA